MAHKHIVLEDNISNYLGVFSDINFLEEGHAERFNLALYDPLTKLPNRLLLEEQFNRLESIFSRINDTFYTPFNINGIDIHSSCSSGASIYPDEMLNFEDLINHVDKAMYRSKANT